MDTFYTTFRNLWKRIRNLEAIAQALADELMAQDDYIDDLVKEYGHALDDAECHEIRLEAENKRLLDTLESYEQSDPYKQWAEKSAEAWDDWAAEYDDWQQTQEDARNAGNA